jgi:iron-sulfur cluster repair protein YtfE (RIC family)
MASSNLAEYQNDPQYPPDKADGWISTENDNDIGWKLSHDALRHELGCLSKAVASLEKQQPPLESWHIQSIHSIWKYHYDHLIKHQQAEETFYFPFMKKRIRFPESVRTKQLLGHHLMFSFP